MTLPVKRKLVKKMRVGAVSLVGQGAEKNSSFLVIQAAPVTTIATLCQDAAREIESSTEPSHALTVIDRLAALLREEVAPTVEQSEPSEYLSVLSDWAVWQGWKEYLADRELVTQEDAQNACEELKSYLDAEIEECVSQKLADNADDKKRKAKPSNTAPADEDEEDVEDAEDNANKKKRKAKPSNIAPPDEDEDDVPDAEDAGKRKLTVKQDGLAEGASLIPVGPRMVSHKEAIWDALFSAPVTQQTATPMPPPTPQTQTLDIDALVAQKVAQALKGKSRQPDSEPDPLVKQEESIWLSGPFANL